MTPSKASPSATPGRAAPPAHLPRVQQSNPVPPEQRLCPKCGTEMTTVGHSKCEILDVIPAQIVVIERLDETVACPHDDTIVSASPPPAIVQRGKLSDTLIVEALADKYIEHQPVERQCTRFARAGAPVAPQTLGRSVGAAIDLLAPVRPSSSPSARVGPETSPPTPPACRCSTPKLGMASAPARSCAGPTPAGSPSCTPPRATPTASRLPRGRPRARRSVRRYVGHQLPRARRRQASWMLGPRQATVCRGRSRRRPPRA